MGTFDDKLRKEQEVVAQERDAREAASTAQTEGTDSSDAENGETGSAGTENPVVDGSGEKKGETAARPGDLKSEKDRAASGGTSTGNGSSVGNIPDGSDDDIVARRLRKAAEQETDPELKEKLWKEYIEYKKNAGT